MLSVHPSQHGQWTICVASDAICTMLQANLRELRVHDTLEALQHLLAPHAVAVSPAGASLQADTSATMHEDCSVDSFTRVSHRAQTLAAAVVR